MTIASKYAVQIAWRTIAANVSQLVRSYPKSYRVNISAIDSNEPGFGQTAIGYYFIDWLGKPFEIIGVGSGYIDVQDNFSIHYGPVTDKIGIVYKSDFKGRSLYLSPEIFRHLHNSAFQTAQGYFNTLLWANDPNPKRIAIASTNAPQITGYQSDQSDGYNLAEDYGEFPKVKLFQSDGDNLIERSERPYFQYIGGLIDSIIFGTLDETSAWIIEISK